MESAKASHGLKQQIPSQPSITLYIQHVDDTEKPHFRIVIGIASGSFSHDSLFHLVLFVVARYTSDPAPRFIQADICLGSKFVT